MSEDIKCFVIMPIANQPGYDDQHFSLVYEDIIKPSIINNKFIPVRADETKNTNLIQLDILQSIINCPIAICDISSRNPNVFYELGIRQAFDLPTVLLKDNVTDAPFDISGLRYVTYSKNMKHRDVLDAVKQLTESIRHTFEKRSDQSEINSIIRLLGLTSAELKPSTLSENERIETLVNMNIQQLSDKIDSFTKNQMNTMNKIIKEVTRQQTYLFPESVVSATTPISAAKMFGTIRSGKIGIYEGIPTPPEQPEE